MLGTIESLHDEAERRKLYFQKAEPGQLDGRTVRLQGEDLVSFSSCSYLGLEHHPHIVEGVIDAVRRYGSQFSSSRGYLCNPLYEEVEAKLSRIFGGHALVTSSTTLGHQVAIPVLVTERDAIVMDHQVHYSVQMAANLARQNGATVEIVRHSQLERATEVVARLARTHRTVWFATDGVFSMYGDLAPLHLLKEILDVAPNVRLYVDDAHVEKAATILHAIPGVEKVLTRTEAAATYQLPADRIGELVVLADRHTVLGRTPEWHDLGDVEKGLRSHGGLHEGVVPMIFNRPLRDNYAQHLASGKAHNWDLFDFLCNGVTD